MSIAHFEAVFGLEKETKNAVRYQEQDGGEEPGIGTIYVKKNTLPSPPPAKILVTIAIPSEEDS